MWYYTDKHIAKLVNGGKTNLKYYNRGAKYDNNSNFTGV